MKTQAEQVAEQLGTTPSRLRQLVRTRAFADIVSFSQRVRPVQTSDVAPFFPLTKTDSVTLPAHGLQAAANGQQNARVNPMPGVAKIYITDSGVPVPYNFSTNPA